VYRAKIGSMLPPHLRKGLRTLFPVDRNAPQVRHVQWGDLRRTAPIIRRPLDRGLPIDRHYIESFLAANASDIAGQVLEIKDSSYTERFGGTCVTKSDVLDIDAANPHATIIVDLNTAENLPSNSFDCIIVTQTLQYIFDVTSAINDLHRSLRPGGVLLATVPGITRLDGGPHEVTYWTFTDSAMRRLFAQRFPLSHLMVASHGNVLSAVAYLEGLAVDELTPEELSVCDPLFPVTVTVRAVKLSESNSSEPRL
jgi:SAM-dependent methyltransferase